MVKKIDGALSNLRDGRQRLTEEEAEVFQCGSVSY